METDAKTVGSRGMIWKPLQKQLFPWDDMETYTKTVVSRGMILN